MDLKHVEGYQKGLQKKFQSKNKRKVFVVSMVLFTDWGVLKGCVERSPC